MSVLPSCLLARTENHGSGIFTFEHHGQGVAGFVDHPLPVTPCRRMIMPDHDEFQLRTNTTDDMVTYE